MQHLLVCKESKWNIFSEDRNNKLTVLKLQIDSEIKWNSLNKSYSLEEWHTSKPISICKWTCGSEYGVALSPGKIKDSYTVYF